MRFPKPVPRLTSRTTEARAFQRAWTLCCHIVDARDRYRCRVCQRRVRRTLTLCAERLEHHHLVPRSLAPDLVLDVRNLICCCAECHGKLTRHELVAVGSTAWVVDGTPYLDASGEVRFVPAQSAI